MTAGIVFLGSVLGLLFPAEAQAQAGEPNIYIAVFDPALPDLPHVIADQLEQQYSIQVHHIYEAIFKGYRQGRRIVQTRTVAILGLKGLNMSAQGNALIVLHISVSVMIDRAPPEADRERPQIAVVSAPTGQNNTAQGNALGIARTPPTQP